MTKREMLLAKMCETFKENVEFYSLEYSMEKALVLAERFTQNAKIADEEPEQMSYAHRAMTAPSQETLNRVLPHIHTWLRFDTSLDLRKKITAEDCEKLAIRISVLI